MTRHEMLGAGLTLETLDDAIGIVHAMADVYSGAELPALKQAATAGFAAYLEGLGAATTPDGWTASPVTLLAFADLIATYVLGTMASKDPAETLRLGQAWAAAICMRYGVFSIADAQELVASEGSGHASKH